MAKYLKKYKTGEAFENDKTSLIHDMPKLKRVIGLVNDIKKIKVIKDDDRLIHAVYEFPNDIPEGSNPFCESSDIIKRFIIDGVEIDFEAANNMSWSKGVHKAAFYVDEQCGDNTLNFQNNEFLLSIIFGKNCALQKLPLFSNSSSLKSVNIRSTRFKSIGESAFSSCQSLTSVNIPSSVTSIEMYAFYYCKSLTSINIPEGVRSIGESAFSSCYNLTSITIPASVTSIGIKAFYNCSGELTINCNVPSASNSSNGAFYKSNFNKVTVGEGVTSIGEYAFSYCEFASITIPESVTSIGYRAFYSCNGELTVNCNIPDVSNSNNGTFNSSNFTKVTIGGGVTSIEEAAFRSCDSLTSINIPASVTNIGNSAFSDCQSLTEVILSEGLTSIREYAFWGCSGLTSITCFAITAPTIYSSTFRDVAEEGVLKYPQGSDYSSWMSTNSYYLGYYKWTSQEIEV